MGMRRINEIMETINRVGTNKVESLMEFRKLTKQLFFEKAIKLTDEEKLELISKNRYDSELVVNLISSLSTDELKLLSVKKFGIVREEQLKYIFMSLKHPESKINALKMFPLCEIYKDAVLSSVVQDYSKGKTK